MRAGIGPEEESPWVPGTIPDRGETDGACARINAAVKKSFKHTILSTAQLRLR